jgi:hypothetical protein
MKQLKCLFFVFSTIIALLQNAYCQKHDHYWLGGLGSVFFDTTSTILMKFNDDGISYFNVDSDIFIERGVIAMSDKDGELLFYSNGNVVVSWDHNIMESGKGFNYGATNDDFGTFMGDTVLNFNYNPYTYQVIPDAYDEHIYYMIHAFAISSGDCKYYDAPKIQISKIDMSAKEGKGQVVYRNRYFNQELMSPFFTLVRHGNGKDWWVVLRKQDGLAYRAIQLHRDTVVQIVPSSIPGLSSNWFSCEDSITTNYNLFHASADGSRLLDIYGIGKAKLLSFDRCSGEVLLIDTFSTGIIPLDIGGTVYNFSALTYEFSPSGRYLYGAGYAEFAQWDLDAPNITGSKVKLGGAPWALDDQQNVMVGILGGFTAFAPGPDGKIYNLMRTSHSVIEHPDEPGEACGLCLAADSPPSCLGVPYYLFSNRYPNYRLGPLTGSGCDTIASAVSPPAQPGKGYAVTASPAVVSAQAQVSITLPAYGSGAAAEIQVSDMLGRLQYRHRFPPYAYLHTLDVSDWTPGVYNIVLLENGRPKAAGRLAVAR